MCVCGCECECVCVCVCVCVCYRYLYKACACTDKTTDNTETFAHSCKKLAVPALTLIIKWIQKKPVKLNTLDNNPLVLTGPCPG